MVYWKPLFLPSLKRVKIRTRTNRANLVLSRRRVWPKSLKFVWWCYMFALSRAVPSAHWLVIKLSWFMKNAYKASPYWTGLIQPQDVFFKRHAWKTLWDSGPLARWKEPPLCPKGWTFLWQSRCPPRSRADGGSRDKWPPTPLARPCRKLPRRAMDLISEKKFIPPFLFRIYSGAGEVSNSLYYRNPLIIPLFQPKRAQEGGQSL